MLQLDITASCGNEFIPYLRRHLPAAHRVLQPALRELSIALIGNARMAGIHQQFLNLDGPTDVMTFPLEISAVGQVLTGEVCICVPVARRIARQNGVEPRQEILLYAIHGMLHLSGFDDRTAREFDRMHQAEDKILQAIGVGAVFAPRSAALASDRAGRRRGKM